MFIVVYQKETDGDIIVDKMTLEEIMKFDYKDELIIIKGELIKGPDSKFDYGRLKQIEKRLGI